MKKTTAIGRILAVLFCIAVMTTGMYAPNTGADSLFSYSDTSSNLSKASKCTNGMDATDEIFGSVTGETTANILSGTRDTFSFRILPLIFSFSTAVLPFIPLLIWIVFNVLLLNEFVNRMYLILFIHNSDGKKGDRAGILMAY